MRLDLFDDAVRRPRFVPGCAIEAFGSLVRLRDRDPRGEASCVVWSRLDAASADAAIAAQIEDFAARRQVFEWKVYAHDTPADLGARLAARGLEPGHDETVMLRAIDDAPLPPAPSGVRAFEVDAGKLDLFAAIQREVWGGDHAPFFAELAREQAEAPDLLTFFLAASGDVPIATGWLRRHAGTAFASLWGGATLPSYRHRGAYRALVTRRLAHAAAQGERYVYVDAGPESRPILEHLGFAPLTTVRGYVARPG